MEECHICGSPASVRGNVEGSIVWLCRSCASYASSVQEQQRQAQPSKPFHSVTSPYQSAPVPARAAVKVKEHSIADGYASLVSRAREKSGMTRKELANRIFIMENVLERIERGQLVPDAKTAQKLEKALGIRLVVTEAEESNDDVGRASGGDSGGSSLADVVDVKMRKG